MWTNQLSDPLRIYNLSFKKKVPIIHNITIECEDQYSQEWNLDFVCSMESEYCYDFCGGEGEFKCRAPELGVVRAGSIMKFTILYSPSNLKNHEGTLKISNKFEDHIYNLKGKPLRTRKVEMEYFINVSQGVKSTETFALAEDSQSISVESFSVKELESTTE